MLKSPHPNLIYYCADTYTIEFNGREILVKMNDGGRLRILGDKSTVYYTNGAGKDFHYP